MYVFPTVGAADCPVIMIFSGATDAGLTENENGLPRMLIKVFEVLSILTMLTEKVPATVQLIATWYSPRCESDTVRLSNCAPNICMFDEKNSPAHRFDQYLNP